MCVGKNLRKHDWYEMSPILTIYPAFKYREKEERYYLSLKDIVHCDSG